MTDPNPKSGATDAPILFRLDVEVADIDRVATFDSTLLGVLGLSSPAHAAISPAGR